MRKYILSGVLPIILCILLVFSHMTIFAASFDASRSSTLRVEFAPGGSAASGARFRIYRVADISSEGRFTLAGDFADYSVSFSGLDSEGWTRCAQTLFNFVTRDRIAPLRESAADRTGVAEFADLSNGLYLVEGNTYTSGRHRYKPEPFLVSLPNLNLDGEWEYTVTPDVKFTDDYTPPGGRSAQLRVVKNWRGDTEASRPGRITVELFYRGTHNRTVTLNRANNWTFTDTRISTSYLNENWSVEEVRVDGYVMENVEVNVSGDTVTISITNKPDNPNEPTEPGTEPHNPTEPGTEPGNPTEPGTEPGNPTEPGTGPGHPTEPGTEPHNPGEPTEPGDSDNPSGPNDNPSGPDNPSGQNDNPSGPNDNPSGPNDNPSGPGEPTEPKIPRLPQTGMLWWPVPLLYISGIVMSAAGLFIRRKSDGQSRKE